MAIIRKCKRWKVVNHMLVKRLEEKCITIPKLAKMVGITERQVQRWVFEGAMPYPDNKEKAEKILGECWI